MEIVQTDNINAQGIPTSRNQKCTTEKSVKLEVICSPDLQGQVLKNRYMISHPLDEGSFGNIYECIDLNKPKHNYVIKVSNNYLMLGKEIQALADLRKQEKASPFSYPYDYVPKCITKGMFLYDKAPANEQTEMNVDESLIEQSIQDGKVFMSYYIMNKYGRNIDSYFNQFNMNFSNKSIFQLGIRLLDIFERIHDAGLTYNDLKLDNILAGDHSNKDPQAHEIRIVDFGFAQRYVDKNMNHLPQENVDVFRSNMIFATVNQFQFKNTSRRDDMMSLVYLLVFLFNNGCVPFVAPGDLNKKEVFKYILDVKANISCTELVQDIDSSGHFLGFTEEIFSLGYESKPNYVSLKLKLECCLRAMGQCNTNEFDWNKQWAKYETQNLIYLEKKNRYSVPAINEEVKIQNMTPNEARRLSLQGQAIGEFNSNMDASMNLINQSIEKKQSQMEYIERTKTCQNLQGSQGNQSMRQNIDYDQCSVIEPVNPCGLQQKLENLTSSKVKNNYQLFNN